MGTSQKADDRTIVPLCVRDCHTRYHSRDGERGRALEREYSVCFAEIATETYQNFLRWCSSRHGEKMGDGAFAL